MISLFKTIGIKAELDEIQLTQIDKNLFEVVSPSGTRIIEVLEINIAAKKLRIRFKHRTYWIVFQDELDEVLEKMGLNAVDQNGSLSLKAPMPGRILEVNVKEGDEVSEGSSLLVLEAMKMENVLRSDTNGIIDKILVQTNDNVDKNQILIEIKSA